MRASRAARDTRRSNPACAEQNDPLISAAVAYCEQHAKKFQSKVVAPAPTPWQLVVGQAVNYTFKANGEAIHGKRSYTVRVAYIDTMEPLPATLRLPTVPGLAHGLTFGVPEALRGKAMLGEEGKLAIMLHRV